MAGIDVGGDTSVMWQVDVDQLRSMIVDAPKPGQPRRHRHAGIDETDLNQYFTVSIEVPTDPTHKNNLAFALQAASTAIMNAAAGSGSRFSFPLPIENQNIDQIQIRWNSLASARLTGTTRFAGRSKAPSGAGVSKRGKKRRRR
jgi:hypothetical protein